MYLTSLQITNLKLVREQNFSFTNVDGSPRMWTVLIGENGTCKTSLLQAVAMAATGDRLTRKFVEDAQDYVTKGRGRPRETTVSASLALDEREQDIRRDLSSLRSKGAPPLDESSDPSSFVSTLTVEPDTHEFEAPYDLPNLLNQVHSRRQQGFFVAGYGTGRRLADEGEVRISRDLVGDRIESLFTAGHKMLGLQFAEALGEHWEAFYRTIEKILRIEDAAGNTLLPGVVGLETEGQSDPVKVKFRSGSNILRLQPSLLSQGYQSVLAWVGDLVGQIMAVAEQEVKLDQIGGIVLIDELDLHLHPSWQREIVPILKKALPRTQFIVTTHSPLVLTGFERDEIIRLEVEDGTVVQTPIGFEPAMLSASQLMTSFFDVPTAGRPAIVQAQREYNALLAVPPEQRSERDSQRLDELDEKLDPYVGSLHDPRLPVRSNIDVSSQLDALDADYAQRQAES